MYKGISYPSYNNPTHSQIGVVHKCMYLIESSHGVVIDMRSQRKILRKLPSQFHRFHVKRIP